MSSMTTIDVILALQSSIITETNTPPLSLQLDGDFFLHLRGDSDSNSSQVHLRGDIEMKFMGKNDQIKFLKKTVFIEFFGGDATKAKTSAYNCLL